MNDLTCFKSFVQCTVRLGLFYHKHVSVAFFVEHILTYHSHMSEHARLWLLLPLDPFCVITFPIWSGDRVLMKRITIV